MKTRQQNITLIAASVVMLILIFDSKTAFIAAQEGLELCIKTVVPSLFPMIFLSSLLTGRISESAGLEFKPAERLIGLPAGSTGLYLTGLLGGYPIGAKCVADSFYSGAISKTAASHALRFINNAGPSFIFGICSLMFSTRIAIWCIWIIQILSSIITGILMKYNSDNSIKPTTTRNIQKKNLLTSSLLAMASICVWVILFRVMLGFMQRWILWLFPSVIQVLVSGVFELTNGACMLATIPDESVRFVICCMLLSFGGICVVMQTKTVISGLPILPYIKGKAVQTLISGCISITLSTILFPNMYFSNHSFWQIFSCFALLFLILRRLGIAFFKKMVYNPFRNQNKRYIYAVSKEN